MITTINFEIPIALFIFKRPEKSVEIVHKISKYKPKKIYLLSDYGRNHDEIELVNLCRKKVEEAIDWSCEVIKIYATYNKGVYENIGLGAKWVLSIEKWAIFLEDDNLPSDDFLPFCDEMLRRYEGDQRVIWICGTNYLSVYNPKSKDSYVFTQHLLPCGWASWSNKFLQMYDYELNLFSFADYRYKFKKSYKSKALFKQQFQSISREYDRKIENLKYKSWDFHMIWSIRAQGLLGIAPVVNLIQNIGVDEHSEHGGTSYNNVMTKRFCSMNNFRLSFPLKHPKSVAIDSKYERLVGRIILYPLKQRFLSSLITIIKKLIGFDNEVSLTNEIKKRLAKRKSK